MSLGLRHVVRRRKSRRPLQPNKPPQRPSLLQISFDILIYPVALLAPLALVPQVWQVYATHDVSGLALPSWALLGVLNIMWIMYGLVHREWPILVANAAFMLLNFAVVLGVLLYR